MATAEGLQRQAESWGGVSQLFRMGDFLENQFFSFFGAPKYFFQLPKPYLALEPPTLGWS